MNSEARKTPTTTPVHPLKSWLRLARISALPSAISNILLGYLLATGNWEPVPELVLLILSSACLYTAGMILNDVFDAEIDAQDRPHRPIPSGQIAKSTALAAGGLLLLAGIGLAAGVWLISETSSPKPLLIATLLSICVLLYDGLLKKTWAAPLVMGTCRSLNILLGASTMLVGRDAGSVFGFPPIIWWVAISVGVFVCGFTLLARNEASNAQHRLKLGSATLVMLGGLLGLALIQICPNQLLQPNARLASFYPLLIGLIALPIVRHTITAVVTLNPKSIQAAVIACLQSMIILDAALCFLIAPNQPLYAVTVVSLLIPAVVLGKFISST